jgi:hypothetical protein
MNVYLDLENPGGSGFWVGGYMSQVSEMGKLVYKQPGNEVDGSCHSKEGSKYVERGAKGDQQGECAMYINHVLTRVYNGMLAVIE